MIWPDQPQRLPKDAPNILIVLLDDVGFGVAETFGGEVHTPTLDRLAAEGIAYTRFHTTSICSPTRASLLTGRNHTRVGSGTIAERAVAWDGYTGVIPKTAATMAEVLKEYGYHTAAFGKWHNTPVTETTAIGPKDRWPNGYGFEYFYGFLGGETSQYEPRLTENYDAVEPPHDDPSYHLTSDMVDKSLAWLDNWRAFDPDKPFFMYWAPGGVHGPHHVFKEWADKYKGKFDSGWDAYRERTYKRQLEMGVIPPGTELTPRDATMAAWDEIPESQRPFQERLMEIFAGFVEHTDTEVGRLIDGIDARGLGDNTLIFYIFGDNGSSAEGQQGSISELLAQNNIPNTVEQQIAALDRIGGLEALGTGATDNMYHAGWAWAGGTPFKGTKLMGAYFGGTRNPMVIAWPGRIAHDGVMRPQFSHVVDIAPTIYEVLGIIPPQGGERVRAVADRRHQPRLHLRRPEGGGPQARAVLRQQRQPRPLRRRLVRRRQGAVPALGHAGVGEAAGHLGLGDRSVGALRPERGLLAGARPGRRGSGEARGDEGAVPRGGGGEQGFPDRRRQLAAPASGGPHRLALYALDLRPERAADAGVHRARRRAAVHDGDDRRGLRRQRERRALCGRRRRRGAVGVHAGRRARLRIQHDAHRELPGADREDPGGQAPDRRRHQDRQSRPVRRRS